jgi:3-phosphoshikimate 1-carboxyvinyltransferase
MNIKITGNKLHGVINIPESKSHVHRLLISAALSSCKSNILCNKISDDIKATCRCLKGLCADIHINNIGFTVSPGTQFPEQLLNCGESGSTFRFLLPVVCALGRSLSFRLEGKLSKRPMDPFYHCLQEHGITISGKGTDTISVSGKLKGGKFNVPGNISSQFISGLIFALPLLSEGGEIIIETPLQSENYVEMTLDAVSLYGVKVIHSETGYVIPGGQSYTSPLEIKAEGDWSNAAFWLCAGAVGKSPISCSGLKVSSHQGDKAIIALLKEFGASIDINENYITVYPSKLRGICIDAGPIPDLVPILALVGAAADDKTVIKNAERLRYKESDRLRATTEILRTLGAKVDELPDGLVIYGTKRLIGGTVDSFNDHRMAMTSAIASLICDGTITIKNASAVNKSYPDFFKDFSRLGGTLQEV